MIGIKSCGAYIPRYRLSRSRIFEAMGWLNPATIAYSKGTKAVANYDEDSITMSYSACFDCLGEVDRNEVNGVYMASTTFPYSERQNATIVASALSLSETIRTADFGGSLKSGSTALLNAIDALSAGDVNNFLVCTADSRLGKMGSAQEHLFGDGAAAVLLGKQGVIAEIVGTHSVSVDLVDHFRTDRNKFDRIWEERWITEEGYRKIIPQIIKGVLKKSKLNIEDVSKIVFPCPFPKMYMNFAKAFKVGLEKIQDPMLDAVGLVGTSHSMLMLVSALEEAKPGDIIIMVSYGNGGDGILFKVTDEIESWREKAKNRLGVKGYLKREETLSNYEKYLAFRDMIPVEMGIRGEAQGPTAFSVLWRERKMVTSLIGSKCTQCGTPQYPPQRICVNPECLSVDSMEDYSFSDKKANVFTYTGDMLAFSINPPQVYGIIDFEGGGRMWLDFTDCEVEKLQVGMPVSPSFRRKYLDRDRGIYGYYWKAVPMV